MDTPARRGNGLRIALVGCGNVCAHKHLPALQRVTGAREPAVPPAATIFAFADAE